MPPPELCAKSSIRVRGDCVTRSASTLHIFLPRITQEVISPFSSQLKSSSSASSSSSSTSSTSFSHHCPQVGSGASRSKTWPAFSVLNLRSASLSSGGSHSSNSGGGNVLLVILSVRRTSDTSPLSCKGWSGTISLGRKGSSTSKMGMYSVGGGAVERLNRFARDEDFSGDIG